MEIIYLASLDSIHTIRWINFFTEFKEFNISCISLHKSSKNVSKNINCYELNGKKFFLNFLRSIRLLRSRNKGLIHLHYLGWNSLLILFASKTKKIILTPWGSDLHINKKHFLKKIWLKYLFSRSHYLVCDSPKLLEISCKLGHESSRTEVIAFGTNTYEYISYKEPFNYTAKQKKIIIGTNRNMEPIYDPFTFLKAANLLLEESRYFKFRMANDGSLKTKIKNYIREKKLEDSIELVGKKYEKENIDFYNSLDIFVSTSLSDGGLSASVAEAMSCKRLVIVSDNSDNSKFIKHGISGYLFKDKDHIELANLIRKAYENKIKSLKIANEGRKIILQKCNYHLEMDKVAKIYKEFL